MDSNTFWSLVALAGVGLMILPAVIVFAVGANSGTPIQGAMDATTPLVVIGLIVCLVGAYKVTKC